MKNSGKSLLTMQEAQRSNHKKGVEHKFKIVSSNVRNLNNWCRLYGGKVRTYKSMHKL